MHCGSLRSCRSPCSQPTLLLAAKSMFAQEERVRPAGRPCARRSSSSFLRPSVRPSTLCSWAPLPPLALFLSVWTSFNARGRVELAGAEPWRRTEAIKKKSGVHKSRRLFVGELISAIRMHRAKTLAIFCMLNSWERNTAMP